MLFLCWSIVLVINEVAVTFLDPSCIAITTVFLSSCPCWMSLKGRQQWELLPVFHSSCYFIPHNIGQPPEVISCPPCESQPPCWEPMPKCTIASMPAGSPWSYCMKIRWKTKQNKAKTNKKNQPNQSKKCNEHQTPQLHMKCLTSSFTDV